MGGWRDEEIEASAAEELLPVVTRAFTRAARRALAGGLLYGYRSVEADPPAIRGRIRTDEMRRRHWSGATLPCEFDEFTADIAENRLLLAGAQRLLALFGTIRPTGKELREIIDELVDVAYLSAENPHQNGRRVPATPVTARHSPRQL